VGELVAPHRLLVRRCSVAMACGSTPLGLLVALLVAAGAWVLGALLVVGGRLGAALAGAVLGSVGGKDEREGGANESVRGWETVGVALIVPPLPVVVAAVSPSVSPAMGPALLRVAPVARGGVVVCTQRGRQRKIEREGERERGAERN